MSLITNNNFFPSNLRMRPPRGFSLVEVLVALVVMAVGMLGIAALYVEGLRAGRTSVYRTTAVNLAADMADRIKANPVAGPAYAGTGPGADSGCVNGAEPCTPDELAADDWFRWLADLQARLPQGSSAQVDFSPAAGPAPARYTITVSWPEPGQEAPSTYQLLVQP
jgi:type IV pilus assembly protein PilV